MPQLLPGNSLGFLLVDVARLYRHKLDRTINEAGIELTAGEARALAHVARYGGLRQAAIAERMGVEPMTLSAYLDRLEAGGLVVREIDPNDRRAKVVRVTDAAETVFEHLRPLVNGVYGEAVDGLDETEREKLQELLQRMRQNLTSDPALLSNPGPLGQRTVASDAWRKKADPAS